MSNKIRIFLRAISLLALIVSFIPLNHAAYAAPPLPPVDVFQLPWEQGLAWVALDGFDNGSDRHLGSPHNYLNGGAIDFAPRANMVKGEDTSKFWVTAAAAGTVYEISKCHLKIVHANGWTTEYQHLANFQVKLNDVVARNQKLAIIANASTQPVCPGSEPPDIPHLHFSLRPNMVGATFAGWEFRYNSFWNNTTFRKGGTTVGLFKPLLNVLDQPAPTPTPTSIVTATPQATSTPNATQATSTAIAQQTNTANAQATLTAIAQQTGTPGGQPTFTPTLPPTPTAPSGPYASTTVNPTSVNVGETAQASVSLNNVPSEGYTSAEFSCVYDANLLEVSGIAFANLFGADPATIINGPQGGSFIAAIAGSQDNKATTSGVVFTFDVKALMGAQATINCIARVSKGDNVLTSLPSLGSVLEILGLTPTPTITPFPPSFTPTIPPAACDKVEFIADINVPPGTVMSPGAAFTKTWRLKNIGTCAWTTSYQMVFFSGEQMGALSAVNFAINVAVGQVVDVSLNMTAPSAPGSYRGNWMFKNANGALFGAGAQANEPLFVDITVSGPTATPGAPTSTPLPTFTATPTLPTNDWLTFANLAYAFEFKYPPQGIIADGRTDNFARIDLPFAPGTNLSEKYLEAVVGENVTDCRSPLQTQDPGVTVTINGISFLKQTGEEGAAGSIYQWVAYSTLRNGVCVSLNFILRSHNPDVFPTPPPVFDYAAESAVFGQIVGTYSWLALTPTPTPIATGSPIPTATQTPAPASSPTPSGNNGAVAGQITASKPVIVNVYDASTILVATMETNLDGQFRLEVPPGAYTVVAIGPGFLHAQGTVTITSGNTIILPPIILPAGDIDANNVIDQFDALTIGMNYNSTIPEAADLNNDGLINVLDLEALAKNYRKTGPVAWQ